MNVAMLVGVGKFFEVPADFTFWQLVNSQFLATVVSAFVALLVARYGAKTAAAVTDAAVAQEASNAVQKAQQLETQEGSELVEPSKEVSSRDYRRESKEVVDEAKAYIDRVIADDPDGRHHRTYQAIGKTDYTARAVALNERGRLGDGQLDCAIRLFAEWRPFERGRASLKVVPEATFNKMKSALACLKDKGE